MALKEEVEQFDYIIIGAGAAGSIVAARLAENPKVSVCIIEAGPNDNRPYVRIPAGFTKTLTQKSVTWQFKTEPSKNTFDRKIATTQGRVLGGSGSINGMIYVRGQPADYNHWAQLGNLGWSYDDILPYFKRSEKRIGDNTSGIHGTDGGVPVTDMDWTNSISEAFIHTAEKFGYPRNPDYNSGAQEGVGYFQRVINRGHRVSSARGILRPVLKNKNIKLILNARVTRILFDGKIAKGINFVRSRNAQQESIIARREIILSAGAVNTARLLQISGLGPAKHLQNIGAKVIKNLDGIGNNLIDHYGARMVMRANPKFTTLNELSKGPRLGLQIARWAVGLPNILSQVPSQVYLFCKSHPNIDFADLQCVFTPGSYKEGKHYVLDDYPGVTGGWWQHRPLSRGYVKAKSIDAYEDPIIQPNYLNHPQDQDIMVKGLKIIRGLLNSSSMAKYLLNETVPGKEVQSDEELLEFCKKFGSTCYHLVGTAKMGLESDVKAVVDSSLRVHGIEKLRVIDSSVMPMIPSGNTYAATMMIAEKGADLIKEDGP